MDKIKLQSKEFELVPMGISSNERNLEVIITTELKHDEVKSIFKDTKETTTITLASGGTEKEYVDYTIFESITDNDDGTYKVVMKKEDVVKMVKDLQKKNDELQKVVDELVVKNLTM